MKKLGRPKELTSEGVRVSVYLSEQTVKLVSQFERNNGLSSRSEALREIVEAYFFEILYNKQLNEKSGAATSDK